ncbi:hypothetical protein ACOR62_04405 [Neisseria lisongii]|uniref:Uncharacterized protein n=1 Tax=Neisseria lisongii TaxID=2912188 RepID=A0AAW5AHM4_9NEIS|nr:hypothetical protein [Neisseria lisongii]MCF7528664.1 hypothetical protein [Neisseria lisongii]MCF7529522.1 hypothetical protein [Neisseria lisongii]
MFDEADYFDFLECSDNFMRAASIYFDKERNPEIFETEKSLFSALVEKMELARIERNKLIESKIWQYCERLPHFKIFRKKAVRFWKRKTGDAKSYSIEELAADAVKTWFSNPEDFGSSKYFSINMKYYYHVEGVPISTVLSAIHVIVESEFIPTITTAEAKKAAAYINKHQTEILKQQKILKQYLQQQGLEYPPLQDRYQKKRYLWDTRETEAYLIEPELLDIVSQQQDSNKTIASKRVIGSLFSDVYIRSSPPVSAITELANLVTQDLVSDDTISRQIKSLHAIRRNNRKSKLN